MTAALWFIAVFVAGVLVGGFLMALCAVSADPEPGEPDELPAQGSQCRLWRSPRGELFHRDPVDGAWRRIRGA